MTKAEILTIVFTALIGVGGIIAACIFSEQLSVMQGQLAQMKTDSAIAEKSLVAVQRAFVAPTVELTPFRDSANKLQYWRVHIALENNGHTQTNRLRWTFVGISEQFTPDPERITIPVSYNNDAYARGSGFLAP
jgi:hypothetical protein